MEIEKNLNSVGRDVSPTKKNSIKVFFSLGPNVSTQLQRKKFAGTRRVKKDSIAVITKKFSGTDCVK